MYMYVHVLSHIACSHHVNSIVTIAHCVYRLLDYLIHTDQLIAKCRNIDIGGLIMEVST